MGWIVGTTWVIWFLVIQGIKVAAGDLKNASDFDIKDRDWDVKNNFCRVSAHSSEDKHPF